MKQISLSPQALFDLRSLRLTFEFMSGPALSAQFFAAFEQSCARLSRFPSIGQALDVTRVRGTGLLELRQVVVDRFVNYLIIYAVKADTILVTRVLHGARHPSLRVADQT